MQNTDLDISAIEWWHQSIRIVELHGGRTVDIRHMETPTNIPTAHLVKDYYDTFRSIVSGLDAQPLLRTTTAKKEPIAPHDSFVDHLVYGKHGTLFVRVDAVEGNKLDASS